MITVFVLISPVYALQPGYGSSANIQVTLPLSTTVLPLSYAVGTVTDSNGDKLVGATVSVNCPTKSATTDVQGNYRIDSLNSGTCTFTASKLGYATQTKNINLASGENTVNFVPSPSSQSVPSPSFTGQLTLYFGWNLISVPYTSVEVPSSQTGCGSVKFYNWNVVDQKWDVSTSIQSAKAYWFYSSKSDTCQLQIKHNNQNITYSDISLVGSTGEWNAVGTSGKQADFSSIVGSCSGKISTGPLGWDPVNQKWSDTAVPTFKPFEGYWIKTNLNVGQTCGFSGS